MSSFRGEKGPMGRSDCCRTYEIAVTYEPCDSSTHYRPLAAMKCAEVFIQDNVQNACVNYLTRELDTGSLDFVRETYLLDRACGQQ